jgi:hypothetical protein
MNIRKSFDEPNPIRREQKQVIIPDIKVSVKNKRAAFEVETLVKRETFAKSSSNLIIGDYVPPGRNISSVNISIADNSSGGLISKNITEVKTSEPESIANVSSTNPIPDYQIPNVSPDSELPSRDLTIKRVRRRAKKSKPEPIADVFKTNPIPDYQMHQVSSASELPSPDLNIIDESRFAKKLEPESVGNVSNTYPILDYQMPKVSSDSKLPFVTIKEERRCLKKSKPESIAYISNTNPILDYQMPQVSSELLSHDLTIEKERGSVIFNQDAEHIDAPLGMYGDRRVTDPQHSSLSSDQRKLHTYFVGIASFYHHYDTDSMTATNRKPVSDPFRTARSRTYLTKKSWCPNLTFLFDIFNFRKKGLQAKSNNEMRARFSTNIDSNVGTQPVCSSTDKPELLKASPFLSHLTIRRRNSPKDSDDTIESIED